MLISLNLLHLQHFLALRVMDMEHLLSHEDIDPLEVLIPMSAQISIMPNLLESLIVKFTCSPARLVTRNPLSLIFLRHALLQLDLK